MMRHLRHLLFGVAPLLWPRALDALLLLARSCPTIFDLLLMVSEVYRVWVRLTGRLLRKPPVLARISPQLLVAAGRRICVPMLWLALLRDSASLARGPHSEECPFSEVARCLL